ncbi:MAG TPA: aldehyde dehydrogenase family protein [Candidatus Solibacter sp.]|jgi:aldehyde dehydrogenase (NAD+)|nr:aldehyde dehydrogenase family protein [Candidatus Solibacter sp.]
MTEAATTESTALRSRDRFYIDGQWVQPHGTGQLEVINSSTGDVVATVPEGDASDADRAVAAAREAFDGWAALPPAERADYLDKIKAGLQARIEDLVRVIAVEVGMPTSLAPAYQLGSPPFAFGYYAGLVRQFAFEKEVGNSLVVYEPVGVVGAITPWNYPLHQISLKVAPALAAGCTVVLKPSEVAPLNAFVLADVIEEAGLPAGVFNLVTGTGPVVGEALATHPEVDMISFTGSTRAGKRVSELAAQTVKRVALELGGKSANVILDDADLDAAVRRGVQQVLVNTGQSCNAWTRMLVPRDKQSEVERIAVEVFSETAVGDPLDAGSFVGPLVSKAQQERVQGYIRKGVEEGARLVAGGDTPPAGQERGYFVRPTLFADVTPDMTIAQEEIFGPVISIIPYDTEDEAVRIANDSVYGLAGAVWSSDPERAKRVARRIRTGQVDINGGGFNILAPFGGYKQSGNGRELGEFGFEEFLEVKSLQL